MYCKFYIIFFICPLPPPFSSLAKVQKDKNKTNYYLIDSRYYYCKNNKKKLLIIIVAVADIIFAKHNFNFQKIMKLFFLGKVFIQEKNIDRKELTMIFQSIFEKLISVFLYVNILL